MDYVFIHRVSYRDVHRIGELQMMFL